MAEDLGKAIVLAAEAMVVKEKTNTRFAILSYKGPGHSRAWRITGPVTELRTEKKSLCDSLNLLAEHGFVADKEDLRMIANAKTFFRIILSNKD